MKWRRLGFCNLSPISNWYSAPVWGYFCLANLANPNLDWHDSDCGNIIQLGWQKPKKIKVLSNNPPDMQRHTVNSQLLLWFRQIFFVLANLTLYAILMKWQSWVFQPFTYFNWYSAPVWGYFVWRNLQNFDWHDSDCGGGIIHPLAGAKSQRRLRFW